MERFFGIMVEPVGFDMKANRRSSGRGWEHREEKK